MDRKYQTAAESIEGQLALAGITPKPVHRPRTAVPLVGILIKADQASDLAVAGTILSLFRSACQDFSATVLCGKRNAGTNLRAWLAEDSRFGFSDAGDDGIGPSPYTLVLNAGVALGAHSLEAMIDAINEAGATVLRALVDGRSGAIEMWQTGLLRSCQALGDPELAARQRGGERWLSGSSLGLHDYEQPKPRLHLRKGVAGTLDLNIVIRDLHDPATRLDYEQRIRGLESRLKKSEVERRRLEQGLAPSRGLSRARAIARKGPGYVIARLKDRVGRGPRWGG